jgi:hypothetical protein
VVRAITESKRDAPFPLVSKRSLLRP